MKQPKAEAGRWLAQARSDLAFAEVGVREGYYAQACFMCQQTAEKALKALHYLGGARLVFGHSVVELLEPLRARHPALADLREAAHSAIRTGSRAARPPRCSRRPRRPRLSRMRGSS